MRPRGDKPKGSSAGGRGRGLTASSPSRSGAPQDFLRSSSSSHMSELWGFWKGWSLVIALPSASCCHAERFVSMFSLTISNFSSPPKKFSAVHSGAATNWMKPTWMGASCCSEFGSLPMNGNVGRPNSVSSVNCWRNSVAMSWDLALCMDHGSAGCTRSAQWRIAVPNCMASSALSRWPSLRTCGRSVLLDSILAMMSWCLTMSVPKMDVTMTKRTRFIVSAGSVSSTRRSDEMRVQVVDAWWLSKTDRSL
mmetsp:Transcript_57594/g.161578  ORF Transcript_57594/g.161578 Transcript_57594/m.161578 type:complete len:251 (-) Transcript_57594:853-1605(-)